MGCAPLCVCASPDTPIATPFGERAIAELRVGDLVYSVDGDAIVAVPIVQTRRVPVSCHHVVGLALSNGSVLEISGPHPTADGRTLASLRPGDWLGDVRVEAVSRVAYRFPFTYDILPGSDSGSYFAGGAQVASTLAARY